MKRKPDWFRVIVIVAGGLGLAATMVKCGKAIGAETEITWTAPTQRCDGTPLTNLAGYGLLYGTKRVDLPLTPLTFTVKGLEPGDWWFSLSAVDSDGDRSEFVTVTRTVTPEEFVTVGGPVYVVIRRPDAYVLLPAGTVPAGVQCLANQQVNGHYVVPRAAVTWTGTARPDAVVTKCE